MSLLAQAHFVIDLEKLGQNFVMDIGMDQM